MKTLCIILLLILGYFLASVIVFTLLDREDPFDRDNWWLAMIWPILVVTYPIYLWRQTFEKIHEKHLKQLEERKYEK